MQYCDVEDVSKELNGLTITNSTTPSLDMVESWIDQESDLLSRETHRFWGTEYIQNEYLDYDGSGYLRTKYSPIISVSNLSYDSSGIGASSENWVSLSEGRILGKQFIVQKEEGEIMFHGNPKPRAGIQNIRITYYAGYQVVNPTVIKIVSKKVALRVMGSILNEQGSSQGGSISVGAISISDPTTFSINNVIRLKNDISDLTKTLGTFRVYRYNR